MSTNSTPWPCPVCAGMLTSAAEDCPHCKFPAGGLDCLLALGFAVRQFHYWHIVGLMSKEQYRSILEAIKQRQEAMVWAGQAGQSVEENSRLPSFTCCWNCGHECGKMAKMCIACGSKQGTPEVRLFRYQTFLGGEIVKHAQAGRLPAALADKLQAETAQSLADLQKRLRIA